MDIHEYQAKKILSDFGVSIPRGGIAYSPENAENKAREIGGNKWVVKAQIHSGARGKAGGIIVCDTPLAVAPPYPITVSKASKLTYNDHGISHSWEGGNGLSSPFVYRDGANKQQAIEV